MKPIVEMDIIKIIDKFNSNKSADMTKLKTISLKT